MLDALVSAPLSGNLRDLQRLALLVMAYWPELGEAAITPALKAWQGRAEAAPQLDAGMGKRAVGDGGASGARARV